MKTLIQIKTELYALEKLQNWPDICDYLYREWLAQQDNAELCTLVIQQMLFFLLSADNGAFLESHLNDNGIEESTEQYQLVLRECFDYGVVHCVTSKYFLWQVCAYLSIISTYYYLYSTETLKKESPDALLKRLMNLAYNLYPNSLLFLELKKEYSWRFYCTPGEKSQLRAELQEFNLGQHRIIHPMNQPMVSKA